MSSPTTPSPPVLRHTALATHPDLTYVWPSSASAILCPPKERQQPHGDDKGVMQVPAGNRIDEARARINPPRITFLTAADPFGSTGPLTEPAQASENWLATRRLHDSRLRRAADPLASEGALAEATEASKIWVATQFSTDHWIPNTSLWSFRNDRVILRPRRAGLTGRGTLAGPRMPAWPGRPTQPGWPPRPEELTRPARHPRRRRWWFRGRPSSRHHRRCRRRELHRPGAVGRATIELLMQARPPSRPPISLQ